MGNRVSSRPSISKRRRKLDLGEIESVHRRGSRETKSISDTFLKNYISLQMLVVSLATLIYYPYNDGLCDTVYCLCPLSVWP
jgi:hypothetical protein